MSKIGTNITVEAQPNHLPVKAREDDAAYVLFTAERAEAVPHTRVYISLGFKIALPVNMALLIQPRSGQSGKGMIAYAQAPKWLGGEWHKIRINADAIVGLIDSNYGGDVKAIVKFGRFKWKHRIMRMLGFKIFIDSDSCICQGRFTYVPNVRLIQGKVNGTRDGLGSTDK